MAALTTADLDALRDEVSALRRHKFEEQVTTIPYFAGDIEELNYFIERFDVSAVAFNWTEEEKCQRFPLYLRDYALDVYKTIVPANRRVFNDMLRDFKRGITTSDTTKMFGCQLRARKQKPTETAAQFASKLRNLAQQAYPTLTDDQRDPILRDCYIFGLNPPIQSRLLDKEIKDFAEAIKIASNIEIRWKYLQPEYMTLANTNQSFQPGFSEQPTSNLQDSIQQLRNELSQLRSSIRPQAHLQQFERPRLNYQGQPRCNICHRHGHLEASCYYRQRNNNNYNHKPHQGHTNSWNTQKPHYHGNQSASNQTRPNSSFSQQDPRIPRWNNQGQQRFSRPLYLQAPKRAYAIPQQSHSTTNQEELPPNTDQVRNNKPPLNYVNDLETEVAELTTKLNRLEGSSSGSWTNAITTSCRTRERTTRQDMMTQTESKTSSNKVSLCKRWDKKWTHRNQSLSYLSIMLSLFLFIPLTMALQAFDCSKPSIVDQISLLDIEACPDATPTIIRNTTQRYHVYQEVVTSQTMVTECRIQIAELILHCGMHHHSSLAQMQLIPEDLIPTTAQCLQAKQYGLIALNERLSIAAAMNKTTVTKIFLAGRIQGNGNCQGGTVMIRGEEFSGMVHFREYRVTITEYLAQFDSQTQSMLTNGYGFCKLTASHCNTGQSLLLYSAPTNTCNLMFLKTADFYEISGQRLLPSPFGNASSVLQTDTLRENPELQDTPVVLMTKAASDVLRFIRRTETIRCSSTVYSTNYDHFYVAKDLVTAAKSMIQTTEIRLDQFLTNKMDYLYHSHLALIQDLYRDEVNRECETRREILRTQLAFAASNPDGATALLSNEKGIFGRVTGEALFIFKCLPVDVTPRDALECTKQMAVTYEGKDVFVEPITRIITALSTPMACSAITPQRYRLAPNVWVAIPQRTRVETPRSLSVIQSPKELIFQSLDDMSKQGIYTPADIEKARKHLFFPQVRSRVITEIVHRTTSDLDSIPSYDRLITPEHFRKAAQSYFSQLWARFMIFGQLASGLIGMWIIIALIRSVITQFVSGYELYKLVGCTWRLTACCFPFLTNLLRFRQQERHITELNEMISGLTSAPEQTVLEIQPAVQGPLIYEDDRPPVYPRLPNDNPTDIQPTSSAPLEAKIHLRDTPFPSPQLMPNTSHKRRRQDSESNTSQSIVEFARRHSSALFKRRGQVSENRDDSGSDTSKSMQAFSFRHPSVYLQRIKKIPSRMKLARRRSRDRTQQFSIFPSVNMVYYTEENVPLVNVEVNGIPVSALIDTGSTISLLTEAIATKCGGITRPTDAITKSITGHNLQLAGEKVVNLHILDREWMQTMKIMTDCPFAAVLGMDVLTKIGLDKLFQPISPSTANPYVKYDYPEVTVAHTLEIPPRSEIVFPAKIRMAEGTAVYFEPYDSMINKYKMPTSTCVSLVRNQTVPVRIVNFDQEPKILPAGLGLGYSYHIQDAPAPTSEEELPQNVDTLNFSINPNLPIRQKTLLLALLRRYQDIFARDDCDLGRTSVVKHTIPLINDTPIKLRPYRIPFKLQEEGDNHIQQMLTNGIIRPSTSPWSAPVVLVKKKDGKSRFCVDFRRLNAVTVRDTYPLPRISDLLDRLAQSQFFSTVDMAAGYWQIEVQDEDRAKTAFNTGKGLYEFNVLPFGLTGAPGTFQRAMDFIFMDVAHCMPYIDDLIIFSTSFSQHMEDLENVFRRLRQAGLKLKPAKCEWAKPEVKFLGHIVGKDGVKPDPFNTDKVKHFPRPTTVKHIQQFLGLASYYRRFIKDFSKIAEPLHQLLKKRESFGWTEKQEQAFTTLKEKLIAPPIMAFPNFAKPFYLQTDASGHSLGAVLGQRNEDNAETVIAYASRTLNKAEQAYSVIERELLAMVWAVKYYRHYLYGQKIVLQTDHAPLKWLTTHKDHSSRLIRWALQLQEYDITIDYKPGKTNKNADALSRLPTEETVAVVMRAIPISQEMQEEQMIDEEVKQIRDDTLKKISSETNDSLYIIKNHLLYFRSSKGDALVLPKKYRQQILIQYHDGHLGGHLSAPKVLSKLRSLYYWPTMKKDVDNWCKSCQICAARKRPRRYYKAPLKPIAVDGPFHTLGMDILGPLHRTLSGNRYILVCMDYLTKYPECFAIENQSADTIARLLVEEIICRHGAPQRILTDRGANFMSEVMHKVLQVFNIHKISTSPYHPQCDGMVEKFNSSLLKMLSCFVASNQNDWDIQIPYLLMAYRSAEHSTTKFSPFELLYGRRPTMPVDLAFHMAPLEYMDEATYADYLPKFLKSAWDTATTNVNQAQAYYQQRYDQNAYPHPFKSGDRLLIHTPQPRKGISPKLQRLWIGPYEVLDTTPQNVRVKLTDKPNAPPQWIHVNRCKMAPISQDTTSLGNQQDNGSHPHLIEDASMEPLSTVHDEQHNQLPIPNIIVTEPTTLETDQTWDTNQREAEEKTGVVETPSNQQEKATTPEPLHFNLRSRKIPKMVSLLTIMICVLAISVTGRVHVSPRLSFVPRGEAFELTCQVEFIAPWHRLSWHFQRGQFSRHYTEMTYRNTSVLYIPSVTEAHEGNYTCGVFTHRDGLVEGDTAEVLMEILPSQCACINSAYGTPLHIHITCELGRARTTHVPVWTINNRQPTIVINSDMENDSMFRVRLLTFTGSTKGQILLRKREIPPDYEEEIVPETIDYIEPTTSTIKAIRARRPKRTIQLTKGLDNLRQIQEITSSISAQLMPGRRFIFKLIWPNCDYSAAWNTPEPESNKNCTWNQQIPDGCYSNRPPDITQLTLFICAIWISAPLGGH
jgi:hypothetical protein